MASLLDKSLDELARQERGSKPQRRGAGQRSSSGRGAPYAKPVRGDLDGAWKHDLFQTNKLDYGDEDGNTTGPGPSGSGKRGARRGDEARSTKLKITNLHYDVSEAELKALFIQTGPLAKDPSIKFDNSGRSLGEAYVTYESEADAAKAKEAFDNALAKGERITIEYDFSAPPRPRQPNNKMFNSIGGASGRTPANPLLARMDKGTGPSTIKPAYASSIGRAAGTRGRGSGSGSGSGPGRGGASGTRGSAPRGRGGHHAGGRDKREAKTAEDLDRELEEYMAKGSTGAAAAEDVDMA